MKRNIWEGIREDHRAQGAERGAQGAEPQQYSGTLIKIPKPL